MNGKRNVECKVVFQKKLTKRKRENYKSWWGERKGNLSNANYGHNHMEYKYKDHTDTSHFHGFLDQITTFRRPFGAVNGRDGWWVGVGPHMLPSQKPPPNFT